MPIRWRYGSLKTNRMVSKEELRAELACLGLTISPEGESKVILYCQELLKWNRRINLIARNTPAPEALEKHFLDSLSLLTILHRYTENTPALLDVGTGAGFPGLVLAAVRQDLQVTLVEPRLKRVSFLRHIVRSLKLENVKIVADRLEHAGCVAGDFPVITGRAVASVSNFLGLVSSVASADSVVICMQSVTGSNENVSDSTGGNWQLLERVCYTLPNSQAGRSLLLYRKS